MPFAPTLPSQQSVVLTCPSPGTFIQDKGSRFQVQTTVQPPRVEGQNSGDGSQSPGESSSSFSGNSANFRGIKRVFGRVDTAAGSTERDWIKEVSQLYREQFEMLLANRRTEEAAEIARRLIKLNQSNQTVDLIIRAASEVEDMGPVAKKFRLAEQEEKQKQEINKILDVIRLAERYLNNNEKRTSLEVVLGNPHTVKDFLWKMIEYTKGSDRKELAHLENIIYQALLMP